MTHDPVNHPDHYTNGSIECIDAIRSALTPEEFRGYLKGNIIKYVWRERLKGQNESLDKAGWYLTHLLMQDSMTDQQLIIPPQELNSIALQMLGTIERDAHYLPEITDTIRKALEQLNDN